MKLLERLLPVSLVSCVLACATPHRLQDAPVRAQGHLAPALQGVWRSRGYGFIARLGAADVELFHRAGPFCYRDPRPEPDPDRLFVSYRPVGGGSVAFSSEPGQTRYVFDRLAALPPACAEPTPWTADRIAALTAETFATLYPSSRARNLDWRARAAVAADSLTPASDDAALFAALSRLLDGIEDPHVELHATVGGEPRELTRERVRP